ncbi:hypothetical protein Ahy_B02g057875 isoform H [Arachis hypogaea]|uniref:Uncharacterized protein n=1 Tax=Arachis hypogaea TaxID=3818 RepID=A0A445ADF7_ARAHY|nr:hypothetical protein Ahy_B02g057875 isoform H [Arachis hypogaea]
MAGEKLPCSLLLLQIKECRLLGEHCKKKHQQIWPKISHIPTIQIWRLCQTDFTRRYIEDQVAIAMRELQFWIGS